MTKSQYETFVNDLHHLSLDIGLRPAARAMGISEDRARKISSRRRFNIAQIRQTMPREATQVTKVTTAIEAKQKILAQHRTRTQLGMAQSATKVFEHLAEMPSDALIKPATAIAGQQWSKVADITHGYATERQQAPVVQIANVVLPNDAERADRRAMHARLDDIARRLNAKSN